MYKLERYGISGKLLNWIKAFLTNRKQRVILGNATSDWVDVTSGVPQGSVLGPLLFLIYINDMPDGVRNICKMYADDTKLISDSEHASELQKDLDNIMDWTQRWLMKLNIGKCKVMHLGKNNTNVPYTLPNHDNTSSKHTLEVTKSERDLGIQIDDKITFEDQTNIAVGKANNMIGMLKRTFTSRDMNIWSKLYKTYIRPQIEFAIPVWNPYRQKDIEKLEKVQRRVSKIPTQLSKMQYEDRIKRMGLTSHQIRRQRGDLIQQYKIENGMDLVNWHTMPQRNSNTGRLHRELVKNYLQRFNFYTNRIVNPWNQLDGEVKSSKSLNIFKEKLDSILG